MDRDRENQDHQGGTPISSEGSPSHTRNTPHPTALPSTNSRTGPLGRALKRQYIRKSVRGGHLGIIQKSVGQADILAASEGSLLMVVADEPNARGRQKGGPRRRRVYMLGQGGSEGTWQTLVGGEQKDRYGLLQLVNSIT